MTKKFWVIVLIICLAVLIYGGVRAYQEYRFLKEKSGITASQAEIQKDLEDEVTKLDRERDQYIRLLMEKKKEIAVLDQRSADVEKKRESIFVPDTPDALCDAFKSRGFRSATVIRSK